MKKSVIYTIVTPVLMALTLSGCRNGKTTASVSTASTEAVSTPNEQSNNTGEENSESVEEASVSSAGSTDSASPAPILSKERTSSDGSFSVRLPSNWSNMTAQISDDDEINQGFTLQVGNADQPLYMMACAENKDANAVKSLDEYMNSLIRFVTESGSFSDIQKMSKAESFKTSSGLAGRKYLFTATYSPENNTADTPASAVSQTAASGEKVAYWLYAIEGEKQYYQMNFWTPASNGELERATVDAVARSLKSV